MEKYVGINAIIALVANIKNKFAEKQHTHQISDIADLQRKLDELTPPTDIETSDDVIIRVNQLTMAMNDMVNTINQLNNTVDSLIPAIGDTYVTTSSIHPNEKFGIGEWQQIKDVFLFAAGNSYEAGSIGGEAVHFLTVDEMPAHTHLYKRHAFDRNDTAPETGEDVYGANNKTLAAHTGTTEISGGSQPHNNMPPYLVVYMWKRIG